MPEGGLSMTDLTWAAGAALLLLWPRLAARAAAILLGRHGSGSPRR